MSKVIVNDRLPQFKKNAVVMLDLALRDGSRDILIKAKNRAPYLHGHLRGNSENKQVGMLHHRVSFWEEYARYQEFGGDGKRRVRNYSTGGTGKRFLKSSGDEIAKRINYTFKKYGSKAR